MHSESGKGTRFHFTIKLPRANDVKEQKLAPQIKQVRHLADHCRIRALVVDDVKANREVISQLLSQIGVSVQIAEDGLQALDLVRVNVFDILFSDIRMPKLDGLSLVKKIIEEYGVARPKIIAVTASVLIQDQKQYLEAGFDAFIAKPIETEVLYSTLRRFLNAEFVFEETQIELQPSGIWSNAHVPVEILNKLKELTEIGSVSEIMTILEKLQSMGKHEQALAAHIKSLADNFQMEAILKILSEL